MNRQTLQRFGKKYTITRPATGTWDGTFTAGTPTTFIALMSVQSLSGMDRLNLPEGLREKQVVAVMSDTELQIARVDLRKQGDRFDWNGRTYELSHSEVPDGSFRMITNAWEGYATLVPKDSTASVNP